jgi:hypothetical protein
VVKGAPAQNDFRKSETGGKTAYLNIGAWSDPETSHIHLTLPHTGWFHTTVTDDTASKRGHPNLYRKLARALAEAGVPGPPVGTADGDDP